MAHKACLKMSTEMCFDQINSSKTKTFDVFVSFLEGNVIITNAKPP